MNTAPANGASIAPQPGAAQVVSKRRKPTSDPFFSGPKTRPSSNRLKVGGNPTQLNGRPIAPPKALQSTGPDPLRSSAPVKKAPDHERVSGFSDPQVTAGQIPYKDYQIVISKKDIMDGLRFHVLQIMADKPIDIRNEADFPKPARLVRRDPNAQPPGPPKEEGQDVKDGLKPEEREELNRRKEQRQKEREANLAQIAPSQAVAKKVPNFKKKVQQVFRPELTDKDKKRIQLNYEEKLPWHLEDFENSKCFVGHNQAGSANIHFGLVQETTIDGSIIFRATPIEKVYQFSLRRNIIQPMTIEEAEAAMTKRGVEPDWLQSLRHERIRQAQQEIESKKSRGLFSGAQMSNIAGRQGEEADLDFDEDFADDEEGALFEEKDEDEKLAEKKIKEDLLTANIFDLKDIKEYDEAEEKEKREEEARRKNNKKIRRALEKRERNYTVASDSEYSSDTDSDEERERLEQERLNNIKKEEEDDGKKSNLASGTNTPSGRKEKHGGGSDREGGMKKSISSKSLKRPGSPNLSDASGTDTSIRKKHKIRHASSTQPTPDTSRAHSPANVPSSSAPLTKLKRRPGSGSDTEMTGVQSDREGGAMSDSGRMRRPKGAVAAANATSPGSRQASPIPPVGSPAPGATVTAPTPQEIRDVINHAPGGRISIPDFLKHFKMNRNSGYVVPPEVHTEFTALMKQMTSLDKATKMLYLK